MANSVHLAVVNTAKDCVSEANINVVWDDFSSEPDVISLPNYIEENSDRLRVRFAEFVDQVANHKIQDKSISELLLIRKDFSFWWMTLFASTRWNENSNINNFLKIVALNEIMSKHQIDRFTVNISHQESVQVLIQLAKKCNFIHDDLTLKEKRVSSFFLRIKSLASLIKYAITHSGVSAADMNTDSNFTIVDHFVRFDKEKAKTGTYDSQYWNALTPIIETQSLRVHWMHHFVSNTSSIRETEKLISSLNKPAVSIHSQFETRLNLKIFIQVLQDLKKLRKTLHNIEQSHDLFTEKISDLDFSPLFSSQLRESLTGSTAARHLIMLCQQEALFRRIPRQSKGLFLCENQPWESAFTYAWKSNGHGTLIAVAHAPLRFWDFRYFTLGRALRTYSSQPHEKPVPDFIAVNSKISIDFITASGAPPKSVVEVESLMFNYLNRRDVTTPPDLNVMLVIGDFFAEQNERLISVLASSLASLSGKFTVIFKPHPLNDVLPDLSEIPHSQISHANLSELLPQTTVTVSCNSSTAALESYVFGVRTISLLDPQVLNSSPLRSVSYAHFVENADQLSNALSELNSDHPKEKDLFIMNPELPRWRSLLQQIDS